MAADGGEDWSGRRERPDEDTIPAFEPPPLPPRPRPPGDGGGSPRRRWQIVIAVLGSAAIAVAVVEVASRSTHHVPRIANTISKADFIRRADLICARFDPQIAADYHAYVIDYESGDTYGENAAAVAFEHDAQAELDELRALPPPSAGAATVDELLTMDQQQIADYESGPPNSEGPQQALAIAAQAMPIARAFGLRVCGSA